MTYLAISLLILIVYHHIGYPVLLKLIAQIKSKQEADVANRTRRFKDTEQDSELPSIHIIVPAFNEEAVIQQKVDSMAWLDYPDSKLSISIYCDGCHDETVNKAIASQNQFHNRDLDIQVINIKKNGGKILIINRAINETHSDLIVFSDASSILSSDTLMRSAAHFIADPNIAVVTGDYSLITSASKQAQQQATEGEKVYWQYQNKVRSLESKLGSVMGVTGAYYAIRREYCHTLETDTINDDFIMPMRAVEQGGKAIFDEKIKIFETEATPLEEDAKRRVRISQGNLQQIFRLKSLLLPRMNYQRFWVSWMFISGKFLRVIMPFILTSLFIFSAILAFDSIFFQLLLSGQVLAYGLAMINRLVTAGASGKGVDEGDESVVRKVLNSIFDNKICRLISYLCQGHLMGFIGSASYLQSMFKKHVLGINSDQRWHKVEIKDK